ncbi:MAG: hypothetical protein V4687_16700 [Bacteroidota bacterium]
MEKFIFTGDIHLPVQQIDLYEWFLGITENDYKKFSKAHIAVGLTRIDGVESMVNVESIGGNLLVQHYQLQQKQKDLLLLCSPKSEAFLFHLVKVNVGVEWKMTVKEKDALNSYFICEISVKYPNKLLKLASILVAGNYFLQKHVNEEGPLFARNIEEKFSR